MRIFYTGSDIEDLADNGIRQLEVGPGVTLTDAARERAEDLGIALVTPSNGSSTRKTVEPAMSVKHEALPSRPRGCQHGPLTRTSSQGVALDGQGPMVDRLVAAVSALKKRGG
jgi:hypothetical protein